VKPSLRSLLAVALLAGAALPWIAWRAPLPTGQDAPSLVRPEHKLLEKYVGTWDVEVKAQVPGQAPGQAPDVSTGTSTSRLIGGGLWLVTDFEGAMMGAPFIGHEVKGYDSHAKQYILNWVDTFSTAMFTGGMQFDARTHTLEGMIQGHDEAGMDMKWRATDVWKDDDTHVYAMHMKAPDGTETEMLTITYKRRG